MDTNTNLFSVLAFSNASGLHGNQFTGLWACCLRYKLLSFMSALVCLWSSVILFLLCGMAQLPKKHVNTANRKFLKKNGFWYAILSGYGVKDKHVNLMVLLFFAFAFCNFFLFACTNLSFYGLSRVIAIIIGLAFLFLLVVNKYLAITSSFWQPRMALLLIVPMLFFFIFSLNFFIPIDEKETDFSVKIKRHGAFELQHVDGREFTFEEHRVYDLAESQVKNQEDYTPEIVRIYERKGIFGMWIIEDGEAIYLDD